MTFMVLVALIFGVAGFLILWFSTGRAQLVGAAILAGALAVLIGVLGGYGGRM